MADSQGCKVPKLNPYNDYIMEALNPVSSIRCPGRLYTEYENNLFRLLDDVNEGLWTVSCFSLHEEYTFRYTKTYSQYTKTIA